MYNFLSLLIGILIAIMVAFNGELSNGIGNYSSLIVIHILGYALLVFLMLYKKIKIPFKMTLPLWLYSAGAIGVATVLINNITYSSIGVSLPVALGLLGQSLTSIVFDHYGLLGMPKIEFNKKKLIGIIVIIIGVCIMTFL
ncbi:MULTISPECIES: DMT family transporter [Clostridium]|uniref:DMT family transporter n=1 Tax=Clostridium TaxID=1485 RepID=UPI00051C343B|nr:MULTISPECIES: DMT family transporter [Clostridium]MDU1602452.1 DMT family transporter [Clostridium sp.]QUF82191.1 DMT family transporter [Clostridium butyricum]UZT07686.1 DMT family transporter [Clostridium sp. LQ25]